MIGCIRKISSSLLIEKSQKSSQSFSNSVVISILKLANEKKKERTQIYNRKKKVKCMQMQIRKSSQSKANQFLPTSPLSPAACFRQILNIIWSLIAFKKRLVKNKSVCCIDGQNANKLLLRGYFSETKRYFQIV